MRLAHVTLVGSLVAAAACFPGTEPTHLGITIATTGGAPHDVLVFGVQPTNVTARNVITPAIQVEAHDTLGALDSGFTATVTLAIASNPVGGRLSGTTAVAAVKGVARFGDLAIDRAGTGYTLSATATGATAATSAAFDVRAATGSPPALSGTPPSPDR